MLFNKGQHWLDYLSLSLLARIAILSTIIIFCAHYAIILKYAVDVPFWDEWCLMSPHQFMDLSMDWLLSQHNEHRLITTKLLTWLLYKYNNWNIAVGQKINFIVYGILLITILVRIYKHVSKKAFYTATFFIPFLLSNISSENHFMYFQIQIHLYLITFILGTFLLFEQSQKTWNLILGAEILVVSMYSFANGIATSCVIAPLFCFIKLKQTIKKNREGKSYRIDLVQAISVILILSTAISLYLKGHFRHAGFPPLAFPWTKAFYSYFFNLLSFGFGFDSGSTLCGYICLFIVIAPVIGLLVKKSKNPEVKENGELACMAIVLGTLASLVLMSIGRGGYGVAQAKSSRYSEIGMILIPFTAVNWHLWLANSIAKQITDKITMTYDTIVTSILWIFIFSAFINNWTLAPYLDLYRRQVTGLQCLYRAYDLKIPADCPTVSFIRGMTAQLNLAKELQLSFYKTYQKEREFPKQPGNYQSYLHSIK